jgi:hypothetical protein
MYEDFRRDVDSVVHRTCKSIFLAACATKLIPECKDMIFADIKARIEGEMSELKPADVGEYNFADMLARCVSRGTSKLHNELFRIDEGIVSLREFAQATQDLHSAIARFVAECENQKGREFNEHQQQEAEEFERQLRNDLANMKAEEREKYEQWRRKERQSLQNERARARQDQMAAQERERQCQESVRALSARMRALEEAKNAAEREAKNFLAIRGEMAQRDAAHRSDIERMQATNMEQARQLDALRKKQDEACLLL